MATSTIKPKQGTTAEWEASGRILELNEWGVEETTKGTFILRIGNGKDKFLDLDVVMDVGELREKHQTVVNFSGNMQTATSAANTAASSANTAATAANAAAKACQNIRGFRMADGRIINSMADGTTGKTYTIGIEAGKIYLQEV